MNHTLYQPPASILTGSDAGQISTLTIQHLVRTQPWVRLVSVTGIIFTCLMLMGMIFFPAALGMAGRGNSSAALFAVIPAILVGALYLYPLMKLSRYAAAIRRLQRSFSSADLEDALDQQRSFWKFIGVLMLIGIVVWVIVFVAAMVTSHSSVFPVR